MNDRKKLSYAGISKDWNGRNILKNIDIEVYQGQFTVVCGGNGVGKTTLFKVMAGLIKPDSGRITIDTRNISWRQAQKSLLKNTLYLHQAPYMFSGSVYRNLMISAAEEADTGLRREKVEQALEMAQLKLFRNDQAKTLSGGQQQRIALARASLTGSSYLFLDEPTANMDSSSVSRTFCLLEKLKQLEVAIMVCTHNPQIFHKLADQIVKLTTTGIQQQQSAEKISKYNSSDTAIPEV